MPSLATWMRSSTGSPRPLNRIASRRARSRCASTRRFRIARSPVRRYSRKRSSSAVGSGSIGEGQREREPGLVEGQLVLAARHIEDLADELELLVVGGDARAAIAVGGSGAADHERGSDHREPEV